MNEHVIKKTREILMWTIAIAMAITACGCSFPAWSAYCLYEGPERSLEKVAVLLVTNPYLRVRTIDGYLYCAWVPHVNCDDLPGAFFGGSFGEFHLESGPHTIGIVFYLVSSSPGHARMIYQNVLWKDISGDFRNGYVYKMRFEKLEITTDDGKVYTDVNELDLHRPQSIDSIAFQPRIDCIGTVEDVAPRFKDIGPSHWNRLSQRKKERQ